MTAVLFLLCQIGDNRYALDASHVIEVLPLLQLQPIPKAPRGVAGLFNYRGRIVPAVDLGELLLDRSAPERLTTRIIVVRYANVHGVENLLGLIAGHITETMRCEFDELQEPALTAAMPPFLGPVLADERGLIRLLREDRLLPNEVCELLFTPAG